MNLLMDRMSREEINKRVLSACDDGFEIMNQDEFGVTIYDEQENWGMRYTYLETLDVRNLVEFNSLEVDEEKFWRLFESCVDYNSLMTVDKIVFVSNEDELDKWEEYTDYTQSFDMKKHVGIYWKFDNIVIVSVASIEEASRDMVEAEHYFLSDVSTGLMETLVHELRHVLTQNPIMTEELIPAGEEEEDAVEDYCRAVTHHILIGHPDLVFVK